MTEPPPFSDPSTRDALALVRTDLANERTLLAYLRTALMAAGSGVTLIKFFADSPWATDVGWCFLVLSAAVTLLGITRFIILHRRLRKA